MGIFSKIKGALSGNGKGSCCDHTKVEKSIIENQSQKEIDKTLKDSFPASDPPGNY